MSEINKFINPEVETFKRKKTLYKFLSNIQQVLELGMLAMEGTFDIPNYRGTGRVCLTNLPSNGAFRGFGAPQGTFIIHSIFYDIAKKTGLSFNKVK